MPKWLRFYLMMWVACLPSLAIIVGASFWAATLPFWQGALIMLVAVHLAIGWAFLTVNWMDDRGKKD